LSSTHVIEGERARIVFEPTAEGGFGYAIEVSDAGFWRRVSAAGNALVAGNSFNLRPTEIEKTHEELRLTGSNDAYRWQGTVRQSLTGWFEFDVTIDSSGFRIGDRGIEPQLTLDLGDLPPYERGDHVWFKTLVENPTRWNGEGRGNDFPALYYYDPYLKAKFELFYDMTPMSWMGADTIARFDAYSCGFRRLYRGRPGAEIGLIANAQSGHDFPAGPQRFRWFLRAEHLTDEPTPPRESDALEQLVNGCLPLLRSSAGYWPHAADSWEEYSRGCAADLLSTEHSWGSDDDGEFLLSYVDGRSDAWATTMEARGRTHGGVGPCLEAAMWALRPLDALLAAKPDAGDQYVELSDRLEAFIRAELDRPRCNLIAGTSKKTVAMGTWQYVYMLSEIWHLYVDRGDAELLARIRREIDEVAITLAHNVNYLFPLQFDKRKLQKIGPGPAYAVAGTYALLLLDVAARTGENSYLDEAKAALLTLGNVPIDEALQEVVLIAHAIDAATRLAEVTGEDEWVRLAAYFRAQTLRMMYWYDDETSERTTMSSQLGMFLACANINYPAFFENIEADARLAATVHAETDPTATLRVLDYGRRNNFSFFPKSSPDMFGAMPLDYIPFEEVPMLEGPNNVGFLGQEVYGAGFTFRAHLMWDALAFAENREVMVVNLDTYRERVGSADFLIFNGSDQEISTTITLTGFGAGSRLDVVFPGAEDKAVNLAAGENVSVALAADGWMKMRVTVAK
jgi:hypothetical protein